LQHLEWLKDTSQRLKTADGKDVQIWEFNHVQNDAILSAWAKHFRNNYCTSDEYLDFLRQAPNLSRKDYLNRIKFPDIKTALGPSIRAGDFGEILIADYLEWLHYNVPRFKWCNKPTKNDSLKGCDIIGFKIIGVNSPDDILAVFEVKTGFSNSSKNRVQNAVNGSIKDELRLAESLNYLNQQYYFNNDLDGAKKIQRFQNLTDNPCEIAYGAAAIFDEKFFSSETIEEVNTDVHPQKENLFLIVIKGSNMMELVHELYRRAADEA